MTPSRTGRAAGLLPSLGDLAFLLPLGFLFARMGGVRGMLGDGDTGWHLRTGEWILAHGQVPHRDIFSFTMPGQPWFAWEWLWDVAFALVWQRGGLALVVLLNLVLIAGISLYLFRVVSRFATPLVALPVAMVATVASSIHWLARPHLVTLLFTVLFVDLLERVAAGRRRLLWLLPAVTVLWTNLHGGFLVGIVLAAGYAIGEIVGGLLTAQAGERQAAWRAAGGYASAAGACLAASLANPYFYQLHVHVFEYLNDTYQKDHIIEFFSLNFHHPVAPFVEILLLGGAASAVWLAGRGCWRAVVLMGLWAHGALICQRNIPIYAIVAAPFIAQAAEQGLRRLTSAPVAAWIRRAAAGLLTTAENMAAVERLARWRVASGLGVALLAALLLAPNPPRLCRSEYDPKAYPAAALEAMRFGAEARIFANDEWGDYLIFRLYGSGPRVFVDGRSDFYGQTFEEKYLDAYNVKYGWEQTLARYGVNTILLPVEASLAGALKESSRWRVVYDDGTALVFQPVAGASREPVSAATGGGRGRDRKITKTEASDRMITVSNAKSTI